MQPLPTQFAPAERSSDQNIIDQARQFSQSDVFNIMLNAVPDVFLVLNKNRQIIYANSAMLDMIQAADERDVLGLRPGEALHCIHAQDMACGTTEFCQTCGAVKAMLDSLHGNKSVQECRITQASGASLDLRVWGTPLSLDSERYSIFAVKDISDEKRRRILERIFFHDILNTAGVVAMYADMIKYMKPEEIEGLSEEFAETAMRLIEEIKAQKELTDAENQDLQVNFTLVDPHLLLMEAATTYLHHELAQDKQIIIEPPISELLYFKTDRVLIGRVLGNMVKNALEASEAGDTIALSYSVDHDMITFEVHNPAYMPRRTQLQVFQRSFSTKGANRGLGTYSIKLLTERYLKGSVWFTSTQEDGTRFMASYPLNP